MSRFTIAGAMIVVLVIGLEFAALARPSPFSVSLAWTASITLLLIAALVAAIDPRRSFWIGFAVLGVGYAVFSTVEVPEPSHLLISQMTYTLLRFDHPRSRGTITLPGDFDEFMRGVHAFFSLVHGLAGGLLAVWLRPRLLKDRIDAR